jgi:hypothetical protein
VCSGAFSSFNIPLFTRLPLLAVEVELDSLRASFGSCNSLLFKLKNGVKNKRSSYEGVP